VWDTTFISEIPPGRKQRMKTYLGHKWALKLKVRGAINPAQNLTH
jgi:hypothetical protein